MTKERRLGRGLEALLGQIPIRQQPAPPSQQTHSTEQSSQDVPEESDPTGATFHGEPLADFFQAPPTLNPADVTPSTPLDDSSASETSAPPKPSRLSVEKIERNPYQPRQDFDSAELRSLTESIQAHGLVQPVVVRQVDGRYQLVAGERRLRAAEAAGWTDVPVHVVEVDDRQSAELTIVENLQRKDLNPLEKAAAFQRYLEQYACTQEELAGRLNLNRSTIANMIRLLELPEAVQEVIRKGKVTQGHARALLPLGEEREQIEFCRRIQQEGLNVRQTESLVQQMIEAADAEPLALVDRDGRTTQVRRRPQEHLAALEQQLRAVLGIKNVSITHNAKGRGKIVIYFRNHDEFEQVRRQICDPIGEIRSQAG